MTRPNASLLLGACCCLLFLPRATAQTPCEDPQFVLKKSDPFTRAFAFRKAFRAGSSTYITYIVFQNGDKWVVVQRPIVDPRLGEVTDPMTVYSGPSSGIAAAVDQICGQPGFYQNGLSTTKRARPPSGNLAPALQLVKPQASLRAEAGQAAQNLLSADLNGDGTLDDVILINNSLRIALRDAKGTVIVKNTYATGPNANLVAAGDFNGDGKLDLAVTSFGGSTSTSPDKGSVSLFLGNGDGSFQAFRAIPAGLNPNALALADFNKDGALDMAVGNGNGLSVVLGNGDGTFRAPVFYAGSFPISLAAVDFTGDGVIDLATANFGKISILRGTGDGTFSAPVDTALGTSASYLSWSDFNHDGRMDLLPVSQDTSSVAMLLGKGDGTFQAPVYYAVGSSSLSVGLVPLDDGNHLLFSGDNLAGDTYVNFIAPDGTVNAPVLNLVADIPNSVAVADLNGDGLPDAVTVASNLLAATGTVSVLLSKADGSFAPPTAYPVPAVMPRVSSAVNGVGIADVNADGKLDIVTGQGVLLGNGDGSFRPFAAFPGNALGVGGVVIADLNGDGKPDIAMAGSGGGALILLGNGDGTFRPPVTYGPTNLPGLALVSADFNGDGRPDLAFTSGNGRLDRPGIFTILLGNGDGTFRQTPAPALDGATFFRLAAGDINNDRKADLAVLNYSQTTGYSVATLLGNGDGTFQSPIRSTVDIFPSSIVIADLNLDGAADLVVGHCCGFSESIYLLGKGDGTFQNFRYFLSGPSTADIAVTDWNKDGRPDLLIAAVSRDQRVTSGTLLALVNNFPLLAAVSDASFQAITAPESIAAIFGSGLATGTSTDGPNTSLAGTSVTVRDSAGAIRDAPLFFASPNQINLEVPAGTAVGRAVVTVKTAKGNITGGLQVAQVAPGLFLLNTSGLVAANLLRVSAAGQSAEAVYQVDSAGAVQALSIDLGPPDEQVYLLIYGTGFRFALPNTAVATIGGIQATIQFLGAQPAFAGLDQLNILIPRSLVGRGDVPVVLTIAGQVSNIGHITIK